MCYLLSIQVIHNTYKKKLVFFSQVIDKKKGYTTFRLISKSMYKFFLNLTNHLSLYYKEDH